MSLDKNGMTKPQVLIKSLDSILSAGVKDPLRLSPIQHQSWEGAQKLFRSRGTEWAVWPAKHVTADQGVMAMGGVWKVLH